MAAIASECAFVEKDGINAFHKYNYASAANVLAHVNRACARHNVAPVVDPEIVSSEETKSGRLVTVRARVTVHDGDSDAKLSFSGLGSGQDTGDKAIMKAETAAIKYAWMLTLSISTGDDPEADESTDRRAAGQQSPPKSQAAPPRTQPAPAAQQAPRNATVEDAAAVLVAKIAATKKGTVLIEISERVNALQGTARTTVWPVYVARWRELLSTYDEPTLDHVLNKELPKLPEPLRSAAEWEDVAEMLTQRGRGLPKAKAA
jgi:hypothetical protein